MEKDAVGYPSNGHTNSDITRYLASRLPYRELLRAGRSRGIERLDQLRMGLGFVPITSDAMLRATAFWADARRRGRATAGDQSLDADVILAGQAATLGRGQVVVASSNPRHIARFVPAQC